MADKKKIRILPTTHRKRAIKTNAVQAPSRDQSPQPPVVITDHNLWPKDKE
jgi:hypothetical protein